MRAGPRRHRVQILRPVPKESDTGDVTFDYVHHQFNWMKITQVASDEAMAKAQVGLEVTHRLDGPWVPGLNSEMRVMFKNRVLEISSLDNIDERNIDIKLMCREVQ